MKTFFRWIMCGFATWFGIHLAQEGIETMKDPYKRTKFKKKISKIKNAIFEKIES